MGKKIIINNLPTLKDKFQIVIKKKGKLIPKPDLMIASIAKVNNLILVTRDKKHFDGLGIKVEVW